MTIFKVEGLEEVPESHVLVWYTFYNPIINQCYWQCEVTHSIKDSG